MAKYRPVYTCIWKDPDFEDLDSQEKLLFLYLVTNQSTTESGIYPISYKTVGNEACIGFETVKQLLDNGSIKNIIYDKVNKVVFIKNFRKYNPGGNPKLVRKAVLRDYERTKGSYLWNIFRETYPEFADDIPTVDKPLAKGSGKTPSISSSISSSISKKEVQRDDVAPIDNKKQELEKLHRNIWELAAELVQRKIFPEAKSFVGKMLKTGKNEKAVYHTLQQCYKKQVFEGGNAWGYAAAIMAEENGNYNEREYVAKAGDQKHGLAELALNLAENLKSPTVTK